MTDYTSFLAGLSFFEAFQPNELKALTGIMRPRTLSEEELLFKQGDPGRACYIVVEGRVKAQVSTATKTSTVAVLKRGAIFGHMALMDGVPRSATCVAGGTTTVLELNQADFHMLFQQGSPIAFKFLHGLSTNLVQALRRADERLVALTNQHGDAPAMETLSAEKSTLHSITMETGDWAALDDMGEMNASVEFSMEFDVGETGEEEESALPGPVTNADDWAQSGEAAGDATGEAAAGEGEAPGGDEAPGEG